MDMFDSSIETWDSYSERLEQYFICNGIKNEQKVPALLSLVGGSTYSLLRGLTAPEKPATKTYDVLVGTLKNHLNPKPLVIAERFRFHKREQREGENIREYLAAIRKLAEYCEFADNLNDALRDRLVCGLRSEQIQKRLLSEATLTLDTACEISLAMETAARDASELRSGGAATVHKVSTKYVKRNPKVNSQDKKVNSQEKKKCFRCSATSHHPNQCYFKDKECFNCHRTGHCRKVCKQKKDGKVHMITDDQDDEDCIASLEVMLVEKS